MDLDAMRLEVFSRTGLNIEKDDPFYSAIVMLSIIAERANVKNDVVMARIAEMADTTAARDVRTLSSSESLLRESVKRIQSAVSQVTGVQHEIEKAAANQIRALVAPVLADIEAMSRRLESKDGLALQSLKITQKTQARWAENSGLVIGGVVLALVLSSASAFYVGRTVAQKDIQKRVEWLDSNDGKYALQLRDAGSLKALATCNAGDFQNGWETKHDGKVCIPTPTDGNVIGWHIK